MKLEIILLVTLFVSESRVEQAAFGPFDTFDECAKFAKVVVVDRQFPDNTQISYSCTFGGWKSGGETLTNERG